MPKAGMGRRRLAQGRGTTVLPEGVEGRAERRAKHLTHHRECGAGARRTGRRAERSGAPTLRHGPQRAK